MSLFSTKNTQPPIDILLLIQFISFCFYFLSILSRHSNQTMSRTKYTKSTKKFPQTTEKMQKRLLFLAVLQCFTKTNAAQAFSTLSPPLISNDDLPDVPLAHFLCFLLCHRIVSSACRVIPIHSHLKRNHERHTEKTIDTRCGYSDVVQTKYTSL